MTPGLINSVTPLERSHVWGSPVVPSVARYPGSTRGRGVSPGRDRGRAGRAGLGHIDGADCQPDPHQARLGGRCRGRDRAGADRPLERVTRWSMFRSCDRRQPGRLHDHAGSAGLGGSVAGHRNECGAAGGGWGSGRESSGSRSGCSVSPIRPAVGTTLDSACSGTCRWIRAAQPVRADDHRYDRRAVASGGQLTRRGLGGTSACMTWLRTHRAGLTSARECSPGSRNSGRSLARRPHPRRAAVVPKRVTTLCRPSPTGGPSGLTQPTRRTDGALR